MKSEKEEWKKEKNIYRNSGQCFVKLDKNYKLTDPRNSHVFKQKKCKEKDTKAHNTQIFKTQ